MVCGHTPSPGALGAAFFLPSPPAASPNLGGEGGTHLSPKVERMRCKLAWIDGPGTVYRVKGRLRQNMANDAPPAEHHPLSAAGISTVETEKSLPGPFSEPVCLFNHLTRRHLGVAGLVCLCVGGKERLTNKYLKYLYINVTGHKEIRFSVNRVHTEGMCWSAKAKQILQKRSMSLGDKDFAAKAFILIRSRNLVQCPFFPY